MVKITLPDGSEREFTETPTGADIALSISEGFARSCVAMEVGGQLMDLSETVADGTAVRLITTRDSEALEIMRHSAAHIMAQAIKNLYPMAHLTIGPVVEGGFYYDIDMEPIGEEAFPAIEKEINRLVKAKLPFVRQVISKEAALERFKSEPYKLELIEGLEGTISLYTQGDFVDLCRGPHIPHTGLAKAVKLLRVSGAYWRADQNNAQLQRVYGTAFFDKKELKAHLHMVEEAKKRDHRKLGTQLDLFSFHDEAPGMPFFHAKGMAMWNALLDYWREEHRKDGYVETKTPIMLNRDLWERSGHWENYRENMYTSSVDEIDYAIKPMNCPGGMLLFRMKSPSYRELPYRAGEIGLVHRHELSGALSGLFRVRAFHQDDAHIFMTPEQIHDEILGVLNLAARVYQTFGLDFHLELSTRPKKSIGSDEQWEKATEGLRSALDIYGKGYMINEGDGAFYGPKIDIHIKDAIGRTWQCGTIQLDMSLPERFDLTYIGADNEKHRPVMIHRVAFGSVERFFGILVEHYAGRFPLWLAPVQAVLLPMNDDLLAYTVQVKRELEAEGIRVDVDGRGESLKRKVRDAQLQQVPVIITIGEKEREAGVFSVRTLDGTVTYGVSREDFLSVVKTDIHARKNESVPVFG